MKVRFANDEMVPHYTFGKDVFERWDKVRGQEVEVRFFAKRAKLEGWFSIAHNCDCEDFFQVNPELAIEVAGSSSHTIVCRRLLEMD